MSRTFYLWDLANTLFLERWDSKRSLVANYNQYVKSKGFSLENISPLDYEKTYRIPYIDGLYNLSLTKGFKVVLTWTKYNGVFTTGNRKQIDWRAEQLLKKYGFDIRCYIKEIYSTFDYGNTNVKTKEMLMDIIIKKYKQGYRMFVYADDKRKNCFFFLEAIKALIKKGYQIKTRVYYFKNDTSGLKKINNNLIQIGDLLNLLHNERVQVSRQKI